MTPLRIRRKKLTLNYCARIFNRPYNQTHELIEKIRKNKKFVNNSLKYIPISGRLYTYLQECNINYEDLKTFLSNHHIVKNIPNETVIIEPDCQYADELKLWFPESQCIFTALDKSESSVGAAAIFPNEEKILLKLPYWYSTISTMCNLIIEIINMKHNDNKFIILITDKNIRKEEVIKTVINNISSKDQEIFLNSIRLLFCNTSFSANGFKSAEEFAKQIQSINYPCHTHKCYLQDLKKMIHNNTKKNWNQYWDTKSLSSHLRKCKTFNSEKNPATTFNRRDQVLLTRLRIGHSIITHQHIFNKEPPPKCDVCPYRLTVDHILIECKKYTKERELHHIKNSIKNNLSDSAQCSNVIQFIDAINVRNQI